MIELQNLTKTFTDGANQKTILSNVTLHIGSGTSIAITGESGSGKSTLLSIMATLEKPDSGRVAFNQQDITQFSEKQADQFRREQIGIVFQQFNLIDCLSVIDNITLPARLTGRLDRQYIDTLLENLGIESLIGRNPSSLSGGEQQRTAIARALAHKPKLILADEPTGNLDDSNSERVAELLFQLCQKNKTGLILVTHSETIANKAAQHLHLNAGQLTTWR